MCRFFQSKEATRAALGRRTPRGEWRILQASKRRTEMGREIKWLSKNFGLKGFKWSKFDQATVDEEQSYTSWICKQNISHLVYQGVFVGGKYLQVVPDLRQLLAHQQHGVPPGNESISHLGKRNIIYFKAFKRLSLYVMKVPRSVNTTMITTSTIPNFSGEVTTPKTSHVRHAN